ncbi:IS1 family transposase [Escherichia coli]
MASVSISCPSCSATDGVVRNDIRSELSGIT